MNRPETGRAIFQGLKHCVLTKYQIDISSFEKAVIAGLAAPKEGMEADYDVAIPMYVLTKPLMALKDKTEPVPEFCKRLASELTPAMQAYLEDEEKSSNTIIDDDEKQELLPFSSVVSRLYVVPPYINLCLRNIYLAKIVESIVDQQQQATNIYESPIGQQPARNETVMIEYSQPNTHKAFHVGHMRNAALGNALVQLYDFAGYPVIAANYIGDVGAHIAKCLWYYLYRYKPAENGSTVGGDIASISEIAPKDVQLRAEWLGDLYQKASDAVDLSRFTSMPFPLFVTARVVSIEAHPQNDKWKVVRVTTSAAADSSNTFTVVCGGKGYDMFDVVAYAPLGSRKGGRLVQEQDMKGVTSQGMILSVKEIDMGEDKDKIYLFEKSTPVGIELTELGRRETTAEDAIPADVNVWQEVDRRTKQTKEVLKRMEDGEPELTKLWQETREWSVEAFRQIYEWVGCRFDHYFHESDVGEESKKLVLDAYEKGKLIKSEGAIGADLSKHKLGFAMLLTSAGNGLYATKDLSLAERKFKQFNVDRSVYVVDDSQSLHFQQVFKTLEVLGFEQAKKCYHLAYGLVVLPDGKMSSRKGNIIYFSKLRNLLTEAIYEDFMKKYETDESWSKEEIQDAVRKIAISTIKYGMLNQDNKKNIVFDMKEWTAKTGNTGPYLMYAHARIRSIVREVNMSDEERLKLRDWSLLTHDMERSTMAMLYNFLPTVHRAVEQYRPQLVCIYLYELAKQFSRMYETLSVKNAENDALRATRLCLVEAIGLVLRKGLHLLGIEALERM